MLYAPFTRINKITNKKTNMKRLIFAFIAILFSMSVNAQGQKWLADARKGNVNAMYQTALRYKFGLDGLPKNGQKATYWAESAAKKGNIDAMVLLSSLYDDLKTKKFESKRLYWLVKAGQAGNTDGMMQARSAYLLLENYVITKDDKIKCLEQQIYWNNRMLEQPDVEGIGREQCERLVDILNKKIEELKDSE